MKLPNADRAIVSREKLVEYLLNPHHPDGAGKAKFFATLGFDVDRWQELATALHRIAQTDPVAQSLASRHGEKYIVDGSLNTPSGRSVLVRTVWIFNHGSQTPRLVTAYPREEVNEHA